MAGLAKELDIFSVYFLSTWQFQDAETVTKEKSEKSIDTKTKDSEKQTPLDKKESKDSGESKELKSSTEKKGKEDKKEEHHQSNSKDKKEEKKK